VNIEKTHVDKIWSRWLPGAMYPSEMVWLAENLIAHDIEVLIECGRQDGVSTLTMGELLTDNNVKIYSIDFDEDKGRLEKVKQSLQGLNVTCVSGDIHWHVPELIQKNRGRRIAVVQDGPKGWEGLSTLVASAFSDDVVLIAQHNLHKGHRSRAYFSSIAANAPFLESDDAAATAKHLRERELTDDHFRASNREVDHSSLGICSLSGSLKLAVMDNIHDADPLMGPWSAVQTAEAWKAGHFEHVSRLRKRQRYSWYRFKHR
jgi:hypothetical protein